MFADFFFKISELISLNLLEFIGSIIGLFYIYLEYKASVLLWIVGLIMPIIYLYIYYNNHIYAQCGLQLYYILMSLYGIYVWLFRKEKTEKTRKISHLPQKLLLPTISITVIICGILIFLLWNYTDSANIAFLPILDGIPTGMSLVAMWLLAQKYVEQWIYWFIANTIQVGMYIYTELYSTAFLYIIFTIVAIFGYISWKKQILTNNDKQPTNK